MVIMNRGKTLWNLIQKKPVMNDHSLTKANQLKNWDAKLLA